MRAIVILLDNCWINPGWSDWSCSTETWYPGLLLVYLLMNPDYFPFVICCLLLDVTNTHDAQRGTSYFKSRNLDWRTPSFAILNIDLWWRWDNFSCLDLNSCCKGDRASGNMVLYICSCMRLFYSIFSTSEEIGIETIHGTFFDLSNSLVTNIVFTLKNLIMYFMLSRSCLFKSTRSTISLCPSFVYLRESPIWKGELGDLVWVYPLQTFFDRFNMVLYNFCETISLLTSSSDSRVKYIGLTVIGYSFVHMVGKANLNVQYLETYPNLLQDPENLIMSDWISNYGRTFLTDLLSFCTSQNPN